MIVPKGMYRASDEENKEGELELEDEFAMPEDISSLENWAHYLPGITRANRIRHI